MTIIVVLYAKGDNLCDKGDNLYDIAKILQSFSTALEGWGPKANPVKTKVMLLMLNSH